jgi:GH18 family chitinase
MKKHFLKGLLLLIVKRILSLIFLSGFFLVCNIATAQFRVVGYWPTWISYPNGISSIDLTKVTHLNIAFANPNASGILVPADGTNADVTTFVNIAHAQGVKVFMSIGGAGAPGTRYKNLLSTTPNMNTFVTNIVNYAVTYNLDGIDVDIEGDILDGTILTAAQYQSFVTQLSTSLHAQGKLMTAALATWFESYVTNTAASKFDWINLMSYDAAIPGSGDPAGQHSPYTFAVSDFQFWNTTKGVTGSKLSVGLPFYGYGWGTRAVPGNDEITYCDIVTNNAGAENFDKVGTGANAIYYNGIPTIKQKTTYALANAGGVMIWEMAEDCSGSKSLLLAIDQTIHPLAVTLIDFKGVLRGAEVDLNWNTANETNNDHFILERSSDALTFQSIGVVQGNGTSTSMHSYNLKDLSPQKGINYYRLAQYDKDGTVHYSNLVEINDDIMETQAEVNPNPFETEFSIKNMEVFSGGSLQLFSLQGDLILEKKISTEENELTLGMDLDAGMYFLKLKNGSFVNVLKIIKQ